MLDIINIKNMTLKQYNFIRLGIIILLSASISLSIQTGNYLLPLAGVALAMVVLQLMRRRVNAVLADEFDYSLAGTAARYTLYGFSLAMVVAIFVLMYLGQDNAALRDLSTVFAYLTCGLMLLNSLIFSLLRQRVKNGRLDNWKSIKAWLPYILIAFLLALVLSAGSLRLFSGEDNWICEDGQWVRHGQPDAPMPERACEK